MSKTENLFEAAAQLLAEEQLRLIDLLQRRLAGVDEPLHPDWGPEFDRRLAEVRSGSVEMIDADMAIAEGRVALQARRAKR